MQLRMEMIIRMPRCCPEVKLFDAQVISDVVKCNSNLSNRILFKVQSNTLHLTLTPL